MNKLVFASFTLASTLSALVLHAQEGAPADGPSAAITQASNVPANPPPATEIPTPPPPAATAASAPVPAGQWTYTTQYGWIWTPYAQSYTYVYDGSDVAYSYVYYPAFGWRWVSSPWVLGIGPAPYWGVRGRVGFAWYAHPWFHDARGVAGYRGYHPGYYRASPHVTAHVAVGVGFHGGGRGRR